MTTNYHIENMDIKTEITTSWMGKKQPIISIKTFQNRMINKHVLKRVVKDCVSNHRRIICFVSDTFIVVFHKDEYINIDLEYPIETNRRLIKEWFERICDDGYNLYDKRKCEICYVSSERFFAICSSCGKSVCSDCKIQLSKCPFCRAVF